MLTQTQIIVNNLDIALDLKNQDSAISSISNKLKQNEINFSNNEESK